tara:strand:- start:729 stop:1268 length:540 start_codon:yes stop_codon:yes gene_type:complete
MTDEKEIIGEGMNWQELSETGLLDSISSKVQIVMGQQSYEDALDSGIRPMFAFSQEYLSDYMHRVNLVDPDDPNALEQGKQELLISMGSNPLGDFRLNSLEIPDELNVWYCIHLESNLHVSCNKRTMSRDFVKKCEIFSRSEIKSILRLNLYFQYLSPEAQEKWFEDMKSNYYGVVKNE